MNENYLSCDEYNTIVLEIINYANKNYGISMQYEEAAEVLRISTANKNESVIDIIDRMLLERYLNANFGSR